MRSVSVECLEKLYGYAVSIPERNAVVDKRGERATSYASFVRIVNSYAFFLLQSDVKKGDVVALELDRCMEHFAMRIAANVIGASFVDVRPDYPKNRKKALYKECAPSFTVNKELLSHIKIDDFPSQINEEMEDGDDGFIIYTSGSTGTPKAVLHDRSTYALLKDTFVPTHLIENEDTAYGALADFMFIMSIDETGILFTGKTVHIIDDSLKSDFYALKEYYITHHIKRTALLPGLLHALMPLPDLQVGIVAGEGTFYDFSKEDLFVCNVYGASECTFMAYGDFKKGKSLTVATPNGSLYLRDEEGRRIPDSKLGARGEVCFEGPGIMKRYLKDKALTEETVSYDEDTQQRVYHTHDYGILRNDGIEIIGRTDSIVKIRGKRVSTTEVEIALQSMINVKEAAVKAFAFGNKTRLVGFYTLAGAPVLTQEIVRYLQERLPDYMIPSDFVCLDHFVRNAHGKIDRDTLSFSMDLVEAKTVSSKEAAMLLAFKNALEVDALSLEDNLLDLGLDSLGFVEAQMELSELGIMVDYEMLKKHPTIQSLLLAVQDKKRVKAKRASYIKEYPFFGGSGRSYDKMFCDSLKSKDYNLKYVIQLKNKNPKSIRTFLVQYANAHPALLATYVLRDGKPFFMRKKEGLKVPIRTLSKRPMDYELREYMSLLNEPEGPLSEFMIFTFEENVYVLINVSHLIADGYSMHMFLREFIDSLNGALVSKETYTFYDYLSEQAKYAQKSTYFDDLRKDTASRFVSFEHSEKPLLYNSEKELPMSKTQIDSYIKKSGYTLDATLIAAITQAVEERFLVKRPMIGVLTSGREKTEWINTFGCFYRLLPVAGERDVDTLTKQMKKTADMVSKYLELGTYDNFFDVYYNNLSGYNNRLSDEVKVSHLETEDSPMNNRAIDPPLRFTLELSAKADNYALSLQADRGVMELKEVGIFLERVLNIWQERVF